MIAILFRKTGRFSGIFRFPAARNLCSTDGLFSQSTRERGAQREWRSVMLSWVVTFLVIALIAGILGFGGIAGASIEIAKIIFFIALILFVVSAVVGLMRGRRPGV
jgi:uncharacterized membrane protein YtjA (UPF0391 family)